jgi:hypothetical protein
MAYIKAPKGASQEHYDFLEDLRKSGDTNMFGAAPYLQAEFGLDKDRARRILVDWIEGHSDPARNMDSPASKPPKPGKMVTRYESA